MSKSDIGWIKLEIGMFDNRKIKYIRKLPDGNNIVLIWIMLLTMAGRCNANGFIFLTENIPYSINMLANELNFEENVIQTALNTLERFGMIHRDEDFLCVSGWEEHQNIEGLEKVREQTRKRVAEYRERQRQQAKELGRDQDKKKNNNDIYQNDIKKIIEAWNELQSLNIKPVIRINRKSKRYGNLLARIKEYGIDDVLFAIEKIKESDYCQGKNKYGWKITFDWFVLPSNFPKVIEGNYDNRKGETSHGKFKRSSKIYEDRLLPTGMCDRKQEEPLFPE